MKKHYLLTMLLSLFCFAGFASAQEEVTWDLVYSNTLSSTTSSGVVLEDPIYVNGAWSVQNSGASQALIDEGVSDNNKRYGPYVKTTTESDYLAVKATGLEAGTYKFSFLHKKGESGDASCVLAYSPASEEINTHTQPVSAYGVAIPDKKGSEAGDLIESKTFEITEAGDYYFYYMIWTAGEFKVRIADFDLYKQHVDEPEPEEPSWGVPTGTTGAASENPNDKIRYVTSASTTGAVSDLAYSNVADPGVVYIYTQQGMTVEQGQEFELNVTATEHMKWCHAIVYVDWNRDGDFDDEGEQLFKVGYDIKDSNMPSDYNLPVNGNPDVCDFTRTITVPADATIGTTRMRIQFTDAWHSKEVLDPAHTAMDVIDKGGVYDFDVTVNEGVPVEEYTVTWSEPVNGTLEVTVGPGITIQSGAVVEAGASITVTATPAEGYQLETLTVGGEALENGASYAVNSDVEIVATFVEESPWQLVASNLLSAETNDGVDLTNVNTVSTKWGVYEARTANGTVLDGKTWGYGLQSAFNKEQVMVEVNIEEAGEYKFSYRMRLDNNDPDLDTRYAVLNLFYQEEGGSQTTVSDEDINLYTSTELPATQYESRVINLEPGTYSFGVNHVNNIQGGDNGYSGASLPGTYLFVGDFKLYKYNQEAQPDCTISWTEPENGTIEVSVYGTGETVENGATVPYGTTVDIVATPAAGYELEGITINGEPYVNTGFGYLVAGDLNIEATFVEVPVTMYTVSWTADNCDITVETAEGTTVENGGEVAEGIELTITATAADGYELESLTVNGDDFENGTTWKVAGDVTIAATVRGTGLDEAVAEGIYYDAASQTLYVGAAQTLSVYDVTGRKVVETAVDGTFDASALRGGIYIAVADGKIVKFRK